VIGEIKNVANDVAPTIHMRSSVTSDDKSQVSYNSVEKKIAID